MISRIASGAPPSSARRPVQEEVAGWDDLVGYESASWNRQMFMLLEWSVLVGSQWGVSSKNTKWQIGDLLQHLVNVGVGFMLVEQAAGATHCAHSPTPNRGAGNAVIRPPSNSLRGCPRSGEPQLRPHGTCSCTARQRLASRCSSAHRTPVMVPGWFYSAPLSHSLWSRTPRLEPSRLSAAELIIRHQVQLFAHFPCCSPRRGWCTIPR